MNPITPELRAYLSELQSHAENYVAELDELARLGESAGLSSRDFFAVERLLQILIETAIGIAKHWLKQLQRSAPVDAYQAFELLAGSGRITPADLSRWKKIIGMRNALVHDYLNVDRQILLAVLQQRAYRYLLDFIRLAATAMQEANGAL